MVRVTTRKKIKSIASALRRAFRIADCPEDIEPVFREAAEGESGGGVKWHAWGIIGLPGAKFHAMTGQMEKSHDVRRSRMEAKGFRNKVVLDRPDHYVDFEKVNSLKM